MRPLITLTTDFGLDDPFVGIMKGVILNIEPNAHIIDITHNIEPQNILQAARVLNATSHGILKGQFTLSLSTLVLEALRLKNLQKPKKNLPN